MKIKKLLATVVAGASLLFAGVASAATYEINIYGASAQYLFWNSVAPNFINAQTGCSGQAVQKTYSSKNAITYATCNGNTYRIRVSSKASFDGIYSLIGNDTYAAVGATAEKCSAGDPGDPGASLRPYYRKMVDENSCSGASCTALKCVKVTVGASDVAGESFTQSSTGSLKGPADADGAEWTVRSFSAIKVKDTLPHANPFVVPFGFIVHNDVTFAGTTIDNLSRMQAVLLFSGQIKNWNQFGASYPNLLTVICYRHAGSGTHATLDYSVVRGNGWGSQLAQFENRPDDPGYDSTAPIIYFNDGTPDEETCVNMKSGAVGYVDADQADVTTHKITGFPNVTYIAYQGEYPTAESIMNGRYDFWTNEWAYKDPNMGSGLLNVVNSLLTYAGTQSAIPVNERAFWNVQTAMPFEKATDQDYPAIQ